MTQEEALDLLKLGHNIFLTGPAGSGKTYLLNTYIEHLKKHGVNVAVTASTGIASTHIGGQTIHSWSGIGIRDDITQEDLDTISSNSRIKRNYKKASVLVIDEISMLHAHQLDMIDTIARNILEDDESFGGMQVILCGDFFQLPPVGRRSSGGMFEETGTKFAHESEAWDKGSFKTCYLHEQFRHKGNKKGADTLLQVLNDIRTGNVGEHTKQPLRLRYMKDPEGSTDIKPTKLYSHNANIDKINEEELQNLEGEKQSFRMESKGFETYVNALKRSCLAPEEIHLKIGAKVMFVKNAADGSYVNGTLGVIEDFDKDGWPVVRTFDDERIVATPDEWRMEEEGSVKATITQIPLRLAWAITIHKSQGMTLDGAEMDLSRAFEPGMGYVALSRVRSIDGLKLLGLNDTALQVHPKVLEHDATLKASSEEARNNLKDLGEEKEKLHEEVLLARFKGTTDTRLVERRKKDKIKKKKTPTHHITAEFVEKETPLKEIAKERNITIGTVITHLEKLSGEKKLPDIKYLKKDINDFEKVKEVFKNSKDGKLTPIHKKLKGSHSFEDLRIVRLFIMD